MQHILLSMACTCKTSVIKARSYSVIEPLRENTQIQTSLSRCGWGEKTEWPRRTDKSRTLKKKVDTTWLSLNYELIT